MAPTNTADVYVMCENGTQQHVGKSINKQNLMLLSVSARNRFQPSPLTSKVAKSSDKHLFLLHEYKPGAPSVEPEAAKIVCKWIHSYDPKKTSESQVLALDHLPNGPGGPNIQQVVHLYHTSYAFHIDPSHRGSILRDEISRYIHNGPLTENEFRMLHDLLHFDSGLLMTAQHCVMYAQAHGVEPPKDKNEARVNKVVQDKAGGWHVYARPDSEEFEKIVAFAKERGIWEGMEEAGRAIVWQKEHGLLMALEFQMREARRLKDRNQLNTLGLQLANQNNVVAKLGGEISAIKAEREAKKKAEDEAAKMAEEVAKKKAEQEEARKAAQKLK